MHTLKNLERLQRLHLLIEKECTGAPNELATRLKLSPRSIYLLLAQLRDLDAQIGYDRSRKTYFYEEDFDLQVYFSISIITKKAVTQLLGGSYFIKGRTDTTGT
ncbi:DNA-binding protein [Flavobacteriaceae bacterium 3-367]|uniref:HTH domain-containing protein n=1 Tax=Eudoraea algarum TaxID=3417568 RepID=UPI0032790AD7